MSQIATEEEHKALNDPGSPKDWQVVHDEWDVPFSEAKSPTLSPRLSQGPVSRTSDDVRSSTSRLTLAFAEDPRFQEVWKHCESLVAADFLDTLSIIETSSSQGDDLLGDEPSGNYSGDDFQLFATVSGHQIAWEDSRLMLPFIVFQVDSTMVFQGKVIKKRSALHRYSSFHKLNAEIGAEYRRKHAHLLANLPRLPGKTLRFFVDHTSELFIENRKAKLQGYLQQLALTPYALKCAALLEFLRMDS